MSELKAVFKVANIVTKIDKPIPFTNEVLKAGTEGYFCGKCCGRHIIKFTENCMDYLYLEFKSSELNVQGELQSFLRERELL